MQAGLGFNEILEKFIRRNSFIKFDLFTDLKTTLGKFSNSYQSIQRRIGNKILTASQETCSFHCYLVV